MDPLEAKSRWAPKRRWTRCGPRLVAQVARPQSERLSLVEHVALCRFIRGCGHLRCVCRCDSLAGEESRRGLSMERRHRILVKHSLWYLSGLMEIAKMNFISRTSVRVAGRRGHVPGRAVWPCGRVRTRLRHCLPRSTLASTERSIARHHVRPVCLAAGRTSAVVVPVRGRDAVAWVVRAGERLAHHLATSFSRSSGVGSRCLAASSSTDGRGASIRSRAACFSFVWSFVR